MKSLASFVLVPAVCIVVLLYAFQEKFIFPAPNIDISRMDVGQFKSVSITTPDGEMLFALQRKTPDAKAWILILHGNGDAAILQQGKGNALVDAGFNVLLMEYRGYPGSTGSPSEAGLVTDAKAAYDYVQGQTGSLPIGIYAHSLGTGVAIQLAKQRDIFAMVLESPFDSLLAVTRSRLPWLPVSWLLKHPFQSDEIVGTLDIPILIAHGDRDRVVPLHHGKGLAKHAGNKTRFVTIKGAGHNNLQAFGTVQRAIAFFANPRLK